MSHKPQSAHAAPTNAAFDGILGQLDLSFLGAGVSMAFGAAGLPGAVAGLASAAASSLASGATSTATPTATSTTSMAAVSSTVPAWVSGLSTASIASDMAAADVNGSVTYAGLVKLFTDLQSTLATSGTTLTTAQFNDLKTIAANLNNGMSTSSYLTSITNALVNGDPANATWTGGAASAVALGNLAVGSSATQLSELIGKWFLGTDLPSSAVSMDGSNFMVSYSAVSGPLFGPSGPSMNDINQGYLGDCYLLANLAEVACMNPDYISSMITSNGNNTYGVRFYIDGVAEYVTVNNMLANGGTEFNYGSNLWASLVEKAYAQLQAGGVVTGNSINYGNSWSTIGNGGAPEYTLEQITGASSITDFTANGSSWNQYTYNASLNMTGYATSLSTASVLAILVADLAKGDDLVLTSWTNATDASGKTTLVASHAMSIYGYDSATQMLEIRNPWGTWSSGQSWDTTFEVSLSTLLAAGDTISVDNIGTGGTTPVASPPVLTAQTAAQTWKRGQTISFTLASNTFTDPQNSTLTYSAKLSSGAALPSWLTFNGATGTFSGTVANDASGLSIVVTATDTAGLSASETFSVSTPAPAAPVVTAQTAAQVWKLGQAVNFTLASNTFTDPQGEALTYAATLSNGAALPSWLTFNSATGQFTGTVPNGAASFTIKVTATDVGGASASETFSVTTSASAPVLSSQTPTQTWKLGQAITFKLASNTFTDPQGQTLTYKATLSNGSALPSWLTFNTATGQFSGTVPNTVKGLSIKITATDTSGLSASETFTVQTPASAPVVNIQTANQVWKTGAAVNFALASNTFTDPQGEKLTYTATLANGQRLPSWLKFNGTTDTFTGTAPRTATTLSLKVTAKDTSGLSVSETFTVSISNTASNFTQMIASLPSSGSSSAVLAHQALSTPVTLASPLH